MLSKSSRRKAYFLAVTQLPRASDYPYFDNAGLPLAIAHRGGALLGDGARLENSMVAFQAAVDLGYRYAETDVHATRDGVLVAFHDLSLEPVTDGLGLIGELTFAELQRAKIAGREPIPSFEDLLTTWPELRLNVDAKSPQSVPLLAKAISRHRAWDRICVASFSARNLHLARRLLDPRVATAYSAVGVAALRLLPTARLRSRLLSGVGLAAQVPVRHRRLEIVNRTFIDRAHLLGKQVHVWTIDTPDEMHALLDLGVDAIMTDRIDVLREVFLARDIWRS